jgi:uncharacterized protein YjiS (DUF1127 family)
MNRSSHYTSNTGQAPYVPFAAMYQPVDAVAELISRAALSVVHMIAAVGRGIAYRQTVRALSRLDDRTLDDIGVLRSEITHIAWEKARR